MELAGCGGEEGPGIKESLTTEKRMNVRVHTIPIGGAEPLHVASMGCWCSPLALEDDALAVHHAKDGREKYERQEIRDPKKLWALVYEEITTPDGGVM